MKSEERSVAEGSTEYGVRREEELCLLSEENR